MKNFSHKEKLAYYKRRSNDESLTPAQRQFAQGFLNGASDTPYAYKNDTIDFIRMEIPRIEQENKTFVGAKYNGYGQGALSALKDMVEKWGKYD